MARKPNVLPSYLLHKQSGQARVRIEGKEYLLGKYGSEESRVLYGELVAKHAGGVRIDPFAKPKRGRSTTIEPEAGLTINELVLAFMRHADGHYVKNGKPTSEIHCLKAATRSLVDLYGFTFVDEFGPLMLKAVRQTFVDQGWVRESCNKGVNRIRLVFKWGVENEMVAPATLQKLQAVAALLKGRTEAHDNAPRTAVDDIRIETVKKLVRPLVRDLIQLQRLCGARSGELLKLTSRMIDRTGDVWNAAISDHKTVHHDQSRTLYFGPHAQLILTKYLSADPDAKLFGITRSAFCRAITRACEKAGIERWVPHQMRHTNANIVRDEFGLEHTQAVLGHAHADMTQHYARASSTKAAEVARKIG